MCFQICDTKHFFGLFPLSESTIAFNRSHPAVPLGHILQTSHDQLPTIALSHLIMGEPVHPRYKPRNPREVIDNWTSLELLRTSDSASFLGAPIPKIIAKDPTLDPSWETPLISAILPVAGVSMSRILNHPNIISLIDVVQTSETRGYTAKAGKAADFVVFEDMTAGCLAYLLPLAEKLPKWDDIQAWRLLAKQDYNRFSLPESLVWHVAQSIGKALTWLHHGFKETGVPGEWEEHDDDWQPILIRDVSPGQIWFKRPAGAETYGECKLGGFGRCVVTGFPGGLRASGEKPHGAPPAFMQYWAPVSIIQTVSFLWRLSQK